MNRKPIDADMKSIVAYGDCNTLGFGECEYSAYPERLATLLSCRVLNRGRTMSTTRELLGYARDFPPSKHDLALIQYGLVDAWLTFRHAPYVLYYPDNMARKILRVAAKKVKRACSRLGLDRRLGPASVVPLDEYRANIESVVSRHRTVTFVLIGTPPNLSESRNPAIRMYNDTLRSIALAHPANTLFIDIFDYIWERRAHLYYADGTHLNSAGHDLVASMIREALEHSDRHKDD